MARRPERRNVEWETPVASTGEANPLRWEHVAIEVLMDIRYELQALNRLLRCSNFTGMPLTLKRIRHNTEKPRAKVVKKKKARVLHLVHSKKLANRDEAETNT